MQDSDFDPEGSDDDSDVGLAPQQEDGTKSEQVRKSQAGSDMWTYLIYFLLWTYCTCRESLLLITWKLCLNSEWARQNPFTFAVRGGQ